MARPPAKTGGRFFIFGMPFIRCAILCQSSVPVFRCATIYIYGALLILAALFFVLDTYILQAALL